MALGDSVVLAQCLRDLPDQVAAFEGLRRKRVEKPVKASVGEERGRLHSHHVGWTAKIIA